MGLVKLQAAFYEPHGWQGFRTLQRLISEAQGAGLLVIVDAKRGDVGTTNDAYAEAYLGADAPLGADALNVHPYLGLDAMGTFVSRADEAGSCLLVVTRSSNPEGRKVQSASTSGGRTVEEDLLVAIGELNARLAPSEIDRSEPSSAPPISTRHSTSWQPTESFLLPASACKAPLRPMSLRSFCCLPRPSDSQRVPVPSRRWSKRRSAPRRRWETGR